jgi:DNA-binding response OmpR family regulator
MAKLLIVDDTVEACDILGRLFARLGHDAVCVYQGSEVLAAMRGESFQLVLLDVMMPGLDGFDVLRMIRGAAEPGVARTPVAMFTALCDPALQERALAMGANEWIVKGTPFQLLHRRLECFLGGECSPR